MKKDKLSNDFLEALKKVPIVQVACDKVSLSRNTVYRWKQEDERFANEFDQALQDGIDHVNDMSESQLLQLIKDRNFSAVRYWLNNNHTKYKKHIPSQPEVVNSKEHKRRLEKMREEITKMNSMWFEDCPSYGSTDGEPTE